MIDRLAAEKCTLCGSCRNACRSEAISFTRKHLDFLYPQIDTDRCIGCNLCESACPVLTNKSYGKRDEPQAFAAMSRNDETRLHSTSGGVFYEIAMSILSEGGYVCGAIFDENFHVKHIVSDQPEDILKMMGSKYALSDMGLCYRRIKQLLSSGKKILFVGCPCQIAGLKTYLRDDDQLLITAELVCHGIPSDSMLQEYIASKEKKYRSKLKKLEFRNKKMGWHRSAVHMEFLNGKEYTEPITSDAYMTGFLGNTTLKDACYHCLFRGFQSGADLTMGDFWGAEISAKALDDNKGISAIIVHTPRGQQLLDSSNLKYTPVDLEPVIQNNQNIMVSPKVNPIRKEFYDFAGKNGLQRAIRHYLQEKPLTKLKRKVRFAGRCVWYAVRGKDRPIY